MRQSRLSSLRLLLAQLLLLLPLLVYAESYRVQVGDLIQVSLPGEASLDHPLVVDRQGRIQLPEVGVISVAGMTETTMNQVVSNRLAKVFRDLTHLQVYVQRKQLLISVLGYVKEPGEFTLPENGSVQMALHAAGGLRAGAQLDRIQLVRDGNTQTFNYKQYLDSGD